MLTAASLRELLDYDSDTGVFTWKTTRGGIPAGTRAGHVSRKDGYRRIIVNNRSYKATRLAYLLMIGSWPPAMLDHENQQRADDRWSNIRVATRSQNNANSASVNKTGYRGVGRIAWSQGSVWTAAIRVDKVRHYLGSFPSPTEAARAYDTAALTYFGGFAKLNFPPGNDADKPPPAAA